MNDLFRFKGRRDGGGEYSDSPYVVGNVYMLELQGRGLHLPVLITAPASYSYANWNAFLTEWERV